MTAQARARKPIAAPAPPGPVTGTDNGVGFGVQGKSSNSFGVFGICNNAIGVRGVSLSNGGAGMFGENTNGGVGVIGRSDNGTGVIADSDTGVGLDGRSNSGSGVIGSADHGSGVVGRSNSGSGVIGESALGGIGVVGNSKTGLGLIGYTDTGTAVQGLASSNGFGVVGVSINGDALVGISQKSLGLSAQSSGFHALFAKALNQRFLAGFFVGDVQVTGRLSKGGGGFKMDHPVDPANKYLSHSFVESPDMKNVYDGVVALDDNGEAEINLPDWFSSLNKDFRYQLTAIGSPAPNLYIAEQIYDITRNPNSPSSNKKNNKSSFKIAGGGSGIKVSWQVTGIRKDPWANAHRIKVEENKAAKERGFYLHADLYDKSEKKGISQLLFPEQEKQKMLISESKLPKRLKPIKLKKIVSPTVRK